MKKTIAALALVASTAAHADLIVPNTGYDNKVYTDKVAQELYAGLAVNAQPEIGGRGLYKVLRTSDGLFEMACNLTLNPQTHNVEHAQCDVKQSKDGQPVPAYIPRRARG